MVSNPLRLEVLKTFKKLHRTSSLVFQNNPSVKEAAKKEINEGFRKNKHVIESDSIKELIEIANDVAYELRTTIAEFEETRPGVYSVKLRPEMFEEPVNITKRKQKQPSLPKGTCCNNTKL